MYIGVAGNIGSGKTTLTQLLNSEFGWKPQYESVEDNPYLEDFYSDMQRWAFNLQVYFLTKRFQTVQQIRWSKETVVQDRTIYEDAYIFADNLFQMQLINTRDFTAYMELFKVMDSFLTRPDLLIYLRASVSTLLSQIKHRNRSFEAGIRAEYLQQLNDKYEAWIDKYEGELLVIDVDDLDFANNDEDRKRTLDVIQRAIKHITDNKVINGRI